MPKRYVPRMPALHRRWAPCTHACGDSPWPATTPSRRVCCGRQLRAGTGLGYRTGWQLHASRVASQRVPMAAAVAAYRLFADAGTQQGVALDVQRRAELQPWLRTYFGNAGVVPDLRAQGHTLRGGQLLFMLEGAAAMLVYSVPIARIGLYLRPRSGPMPTGERRDGRLLAQYWAEGDTAFALIGPATQTRMRTIAPLLRNQG